MSSPHYSASVHTMPVEEQAPEYFRLIKAQAVWDQALEKYRIDIRFEATTEVTPRTRGHTDAPMNSSSDINERG
jgi:hypothetical protein